MKIVRISALLIAVLAFGYVLIFTGSDNDEGETVSSAEIYIAADEIPKQTVIQEEMIKALTVNIDSIENYHITDKEYIIGSVASENLYSGDVIRAERIDNTGYMSAGLGYIVPEGMRAITINVNYNTGLAGLLEVGNKVDVVTVFEAEGIDGVDSQGRLHFPEDSDAMAAALTLQNREVLALDQNIGANNEYIGSEYVTVTLLVTPTEAIETALFHTAGSSNWLVGRNQEDLEILDADLIKNVYFREIPFHNR
ncbi:pilus assembly protein CpaB [Tindallia magadiensis]|uniref:Pilus assembly protein CpaB n=1 Tax=Tindallia magadiensis TaxID=69895 RepID=A0A1I3EIZ0_9FIRM|nr:Flp pilus assembly protein CpaB [Tindallia magadiensis]SFH98907.1 pilus assembly protein CpaB [Tindallia magadiensis]